MANREYTALVRPNGGFKETLVPYSKIKRRGVEYVFLRIIQVGLDRGKIEVGESRDGVVVSLQKLYPSEFGCEVVY